MRKTKIQQKIRIQYPDLVDKYLKELCPNCLEYNRECISFLLPVTTTGEKCPYFREVKNG